MYSGIGALSNNVNLLQSREFALAG
jgi:hypothetical protein